MDYSSYYISGYFRPKIRILYIICLCKSEIQVKVNAEQAEFYKCFYSLHPPKKKPLINPGEKTNYQHQYLT